jgi:hypothetical protein
VSHPEDDSARERSSIGTQERQPLGAYVRAPVPRTLAREVHPVRLPKLYLQRWLRATATRQRWVDARQNRSVTIRRGCVQNSIESWLALVLEDDKALASGRGRSALDALEGALLAMGLMG